MTDLHSDRARPARTVLAGRACFVFFVALVAISACAPRERARQAKQTVQLQVLVVGYSNWARAENAAKPDVREYSCAAGDTFGGGRPPACCQDEGPFVLVSALNDSTAVIRYPRCLVVLRSWAWIAGSFDRAIERNNGPDTITVTTNWRHFNTYVTDGGCAYSVRIKR